MLQGFAPLGQVASLLPYDRIFLHSRPPKNATRRRVAQCPDIECELSAGALALAKIGGNVRVGHLQRAPGYLKHRIRPHDLISGEWMEPLGSEVHTGDGLFPGRLRNETGPGE